MKKLYYSIFWTRWGWFGLAGNKQAIIRTCLPINNPDRIRGILLSGLDAPYNDPLYFSLVQNDIKSYFEGNYIDFRKVPTDLRGRTDFQKNVLKALKTVKYGHTITYSWLAHKIGRPNAVRAIGQVMSVNPLPLIIPCHRVIRADGSPGGFSAAGGTRTKLRMLQIEK